MKNILAILILAVGCESPAPTAQEIIDESINRSGLNQLDRAKVNFNFRKINYAFSQSDGKFNYARTQFDSISNEIKDVLTNDGLQRFFNDSLITLEQKKIDAYSSSVNSVMYFAFLPYRLNDIAVNKEYANTVELNGTLYHKIKVTFNAEGGGEDFEDVFYYWFDVNDYSMDYLAYSYEEKDGKGMRFRVAYNSRTINGVTIQDYKNLKPRIKNSIPLAEIDQAYLDDKLDQLSVIELDNVEIEML